MIEDALGPVTVVVELRARPESAEQTNAEVMAAAEAWGGEPGCTGISVLRDPDTAGHFLVIETFESATAFEDHVSRPSTTAFAGRVQQLLAAPPVRSIWRRDGADPLEQMRNPS